MNFPSAASWQRAAPSLEYEASVHISKGCPSLGKVRIVGEVNNRFTWLKAS